MAKIHKQVDKVLESNPHMTRLEAINFVTSKASKKRDIKINMNQKAQDRAKIKKGTIPKKSVIAVSGGKFSPK
ncbi:hypothetical protein [Methylophaga nitratireducenticrescens]|uniref:hypothetical protein n=1 Tax=Methylophaga nitratireducenticrescens TaxID=754476 RepID=UPI000CDC60AA|nr:hypothetical protein [Methylophaga nitratireducenticrescens]AUZ83794.1 hypothetical protein CDW43_04055 [Methylophaga nitratireducenticrescens]